ncbi:MAG: GMC oxidoreductase [Bacteroidota bacterium]
MHPYKKTANKVLLQIGKDQFKEIQINKALIVSGGCLASSHFLMRSEVKGNVGKHLACNYAFPFTFEYAEELKAYDGTQINMAAIEQELGLVFETYFNPPGAFALTLPFHFKTHLEIMENYSHYLNLGILIGSDNSGTISPKPDPLSGRAFSFDLNPGELEKIKTGFLKLLEVARLSGAKSGILPLKPGIRVDLQDPSAYPTFVEAFTAHSLSQSEIVLNSAHPQGGNLMAGDDSRHKENRVVNAQFKLEDHTNVYVVDGSVFPRSLGVNPQWTIMALSSMAAKHIARTHS